MIRSILGSLVTASLLIFHQVHAGQIAQVVDATNFCTFLPPSDSTDRLISDTEWNGAVFCTGNTPKAAGSGKLASGFIQSAHFVATEDYVQVTGQINPSKENLDLSDWGGQYDIKAPNGASCAGYKYFVNLVEPASYTYCIRCCNNVANCNRGISEKGCAHIIPGDYSGPMDTSITGSTTTSSSAKPTQSATVIPAADSSSTKTSASSSATAVPAADSSSTKTSASSSSATVTAVTTATAVGSQNAAAKGSSVAAVSSVASVSSMAAAVSSGAVSKSAGVSSPASSPLDIISAQSVNTESAADTIHLAGAAMAFALFAGVMMVSM